MDEAILRAVNELAANPFVAVLGVVLSSKWFAAAVCAPIGVLLLKQKRWIAILSVALSMGVADVVSSQIVKPAIGRERPCRALTGLVQPAKCGTGKSFPSNHAVNAFALLVAAAPLFRFGWAILAPIAVAIATSRLILGVHYPSDLIGGALVGSIFGAIAWLVRNKLERDARKTSPLPSTSP